MVRYILLAWMGIALACGAVLPNPHFGGDERDCPDMCATLRILECDPWWPAGTTCVSWCVANERDPGTPSLCPRWVTGALDCGQAERARYCGR